MKNVQELIARISGCLSCRHPKDSVACQQDAWWILEAITGKTEAQLLAHGTIELSHEEEEKLERWMQLHIDEHMPLQYLIGWVPFCDVKIVVAPPTLIPRPETEEWTFKLIQQLRGYKEKFTVLDLCAGTGCIAIAIAKACPQADVYAVDISDEAIALIKKNCEQNLVNNVTIIQSDLFDELSSKSFDLIVTNPPYIAPEEWSSLDTSVTQWEDKRALIAADHGLEIIKRIIAHGKQFIKPHSWLREHHVKQLRIEIGYAQGPVVSKLLAQAGYTNISVEKDLEGKDRVVCADI
jgi:release factor glutamine methyltransferase